MTLDTPRCLEEPLLTSEIELFSRIPGLHGAFMQRLFAFGASIATSGRWRYNGGMEETNPGRVMLRHTLATLAYRGGKAVRDVPPAFAGFTPGPTSRTPAQILAHMGDLMDWALSMARGSERWRDSSTRDWDAECVRFFTAVGAFDAYLAGEEPLRVPAEKLFQGPVADALTHVGQIAQLRRLAGCPMRGENYYLADIVAGRVGAEQAPPRREFD